uniref:Putative glycosyltransferase n=1 Tax=viral metagenome TaxID=1070528 RepID=A0A6M3J1Q9_9ZZZZ
MKPFLIRTPEFKVDSGGIRVMYGLYGWLLAKGQITFVNTAVNMASVGIYPEIYHGNDMFASKVIRWILQKPGMMGMGTPGVNFKAGPTEFPPTDEIYVFSKVYDEWGVDDDHILFLPIINLHLFKDQGRKRDKIAFYVGKGTKGNQHPVEAVELNRELARDQQVLADFLNECEVLYVYDRMSAIMECARLCGCRVVYLGDMLEEQLKLYEPGLNGLGYKKDAELDQKAFVASYKALRSVFSHKLNIFIDHTQK